MVIEVVKTIGRIEEIADEWDRTLEASKAERVFLTADWLVSWWKAYQPNGELIVLVVRKTHNTIQGIAPLYLTHKKLWGFFPYRSIQFLGDGTHDSEYLDFFCVSGHERTVFNDMLQWLSDRESLWDLCEWNGIPAMSQTLPSIQSWVQEAGYDMNVQVNKCCHIPLPPNWNQYINSLNRGHRKNVKYYCNRAEKRGQVEYRIPSTPAEIASGIEILFQLHQRRWNALGKPGSFQNCKRRRFYSMMAERFFSRHSLDLRILRLFGKPAAVQIGLIYKGVFSALQEGFDPDLALESPGIVLRAKAIEKLINDRIHTYDFLGGFSDAKERWGTKTHYCQSLKIAKRSFRSQLIFRLPLFTVSLKNRLRGIMPRPMMALIKSLMTMFSANTGNR